MLWQRPSQPARKPKVEVFVALNLIAIRSSITPHPTTFGDDRARRTVANWPTCIHTTGDDDYNNFRSRREQDSDSAVLGVGVSTMLLKEACCEESAGEGLDTVVKVGGEATSLSHDPAA